MESRKMTKVKKVRYQAKGMRCPSCEPLMEEKQPTNLWLVLVISLFLIATFILFNKSGLAALVSVNSASSLPVFFIFGLLAGFSTCAALVGGIVLSMSKKWSNSYQPHLFFYLGRVLSYLVLGMALGAIGSIFQLSALFSSLLTFAVALLMIILGLQMVGIKLPGSFQLGLPRFFTRLVAKKIDSNNGYFPFLTGALTFFLPCGFTLTVQALAIVSRNPIQAGLMLLVFALGTLPSLLLISFSSLKFLEKPHFSNVFLKVAGVLVLFFALYNTNSQLNALGLRSLSDWGSRPVNGAESGLAPIVSGKQVLKMEAFSSGYQPNYFRVKAGVPVRWEITDQGVSGCTNAVISKGLFSGQIDLGGGKVSIKEFTPQEPGSYKFSCWMGMVSGTIEVEI